MLWGMPESAARYTVECQEGVARCVLAGDWTLEARRPAVDPAREVGRSVRRLEFACGGLGAWDSGLLVFLLALADHCQRESITLDLSGLPGHARSLLELATAVPVQEEAQRQPRPSTMLGQIGRAVLDQAADIREMVAFAGECAVSAWSILRGRGRMRGRNLLLIMERCGPDALPIVALISGLVGVIISFLGAMILRRMSAEVYVSYIVGYGMLRELGALMTGMIMAGRTGAAFAAELGSMRVSEEMDALETLGVPPMDFLVLPRLVGLTLMMPLLTAFADVLGIGGGYLVSAAMLGIPATQFFGGLRDVMSMPDVTVGLAKGAVFGLLIGFAGCLRGMRCGRSAGAVGEAATSAVVTSVTLIVIANAVVDWLAIVYEW